MSTILIKNGVYRNQPVTNVSFTLVKGYQTGAKGGYVTVNLMDILVKNTRMFVLK